MAQVFEDFISEIQTDMVDVCLEYVQDQADYIYIYGATEEHMYYGSYFYKIGGEFVEKDKVNRIIPGIDTSASVQTQVGKILVEDLLKLKSVCEHFGRKLPTEIKLVYDVEKNSLTADYSYENTLEKSGLIGADAVENWFENLNS